MCGIKLSDVMTTTEAGTYWGIDTSTIRHAIDGGKLVEGEEYRKSGPRVWLITKTSHAALYISPKRL